MGEIKIWTIAILASTVIAYLSIAFIQWDFNPGAWPGEARGFAAFFLVMSSVFIGAVPDWKWRCR